MTNGCFDLLHAGHVSFLGKARELGDFLIVAVNSDSSVKNIKGEHRPIYSLDQRLKILNAITYIDALVVFDQDTPRDLIMKINPDILVKGEDYQVSNIVGADYVMENGGKVVTIALEKGISTTSTINKIKLNN